MWTEGPRRLACPWAMSGWGRTLYFLRFSFWNQVAGEATGRFLLQSLLAPLSVPTSRRPDLGCISFFSFQTSLSTQACPRGFVLPRAPGLGGPPAR